MANAEVTGAGAQRREPKAVRFWRPVDRLVNGRSPPWLSLETQTACPLPDSLHQPNGWRKEPERKPHQPDYHLNWTTPRLGHAMNNYAAGDFGNQPRQPLFRPWPSSTQAALLPYPMPRPLHGARQKWRRPGPITPQATAAVTELIFMRCFCRIKISGV